MTQFRSPNYEVIDFKKFIRYHLGIANFFLGEDGLIQESALENAFEGSRWPDLLRIARRRNDPSFIADRIYNKLMKGGDPNAGVARARLMNRENWYLPFKL